MTDKEYTEVNSALDFLQEFDDDEWYQEAFGIVFNYIIKLEKEIENLQDTISEEDAISRTEAIENFASWYGHDYNNQGYYRLLKQMPSVAPSYNSIKTELKPCEDCVSREALVNELKCGYWNKELQSTKTDPCVIDAMIDWSIRTVKSQPSVTPQTRWIPVSERLPEKLGTYLATIEIGERSVLTFVDLCDRGRGERRFDCGTVTAWMPLPQPYKAESEDAE